MLVNKMKDNFTQISNEIIINKNISSGALRVYLYVSSKPTGWNVFNKDIQKRLGIKQHQTLANYWKELIKEEYVTREKVTSNSKESKKYAVGSYIYTLLWKNHNNENHSLEKNHPHNNTKTLKKKESKREQEQVIPLRSISLSPILISNSDTLPHAPRKVIQQVENEYSDNLDEDVIEIINKFISYRDEMYVNTRDKKYGLKTFRAVGNFMKAIVDTDVNEAFELMTNNEWATYNPHWVNNGRKR